MGTNASESEKVLAELACARLGGKAGFRVETVAAKAYPQAKRCTHTIFVADAPGIGS